MRDEKRIKKILKQIEVVWKKYPDLRLFQLLLNPLGLPGHTELYYLEDDTLSEILKKYYESK
jgi:uncharacterized protein YihD (DUF1040 family)